MARKIAENSVCFYCGCLISGRAEFDHFPIPKEAGGKDTVPCCVSCHDMKDRYPLGKWPAEWIRQIVVDFPRLSRETKLFLAKSMRLFLVQSPDLRNGRDEDAAIRYEDKFPEFIRLCDETEPGTTLIIAAPEVLGDTYEEITQSLRRLSAKGLHLAIANASKTQTSVDA